jgi:hypothetical protein
MGTWTNKSLAHRSKLRAAGCLYNARGRAANGRCHCDGTSHRRRDARVGAIIEGKPSPGVRCRPRSFCSDIEDADCAQRLLRQQHHRDEKRGWFGRYSVRRLRRQDPELPPSHEGLELHGASLSPACRDFEGQLELRRSAANELTRQWLARSAFGTKQTCNALTNVRYRG